MSMSTLFRCLTCCLVGVGLASSAQAPRPADTILVNGNVITVDDAQPRAQAVAIAAGRILAVGTDAEVRAHETAATRVIDLGGRTVVPGLADNHFHSAGGGAGVDLSGARTLAEVLSAIAAAVREAAPGAVVVTNSDWHEAQLAEQRLPLRRDLDAVAPDQYELLAELKRRGELRIRVNFLFRARGARTAEELGALVDAWPATQDEGDEWLRVGGVKLGVDGGFEGGWMREAVRRAVWSRRDVPRLADDAGRPVHDGGVGTESPRLARGHARRRRRGDRPG